MDGSSSSSSVNLRPDSLTCSWPPPPSAATPPPPPPSSCSNEPISVQLFVAHSAVDGLSLPCAFVSIWPDCSARGITQKKKRINDHLHLINIHGASTLVSGRRQLLFGQLWTHDQGLICIKTTFIHRRHFSKFQVNFNF